MNDHVPVSQRIPVKPPTHWHLLSPTHTPPFLHADTHLTGSEEENKHTHTHTHTVLVMCV